MGSPWWGEEILEISFPGVLIAIATVFAVHYLWFDVSYLLQHTWSCSHYSLLFALPAGCQGSAALPAAPAPRHAQALIPGLGREAAPERAQSQACSSLAPEVPLAYVSPKLMRASTPAPITL